MPASELEAVRQEIAELRSLIKAAPKPKTKDARPMVNMRVTHEEMALLDAAADALGISRAQFLRQCVIKATGLDIVAEPEIPPQFRKLHAHRKAARDKFRDGKTDTGQMDRADASRRAARKITMLNLEASAIAREFGDARDARNVPGLLAETAKKF